MDHRTLYGVTIVTFSIGDRALGLTELQALRLVHGLAATAASSPGSHALAARVRDAVRQREPARAGDETDVSLTAEEQLELLLALERFEWNAEWETGFTDLRAALREECFANRPRTSGRSGDPRRVS